MCDVFGGFFQNVKTRDKIGNGVYQYLCPERKFGQKHFCYKYRNAEKDSRNAEQYYRLFVVLAVSVVVAMSAGTAVVAVTRLFIVVVMLMVFMTAAIVVYIL